MRGCHHVNREFDRPTMQELEGVPEARLLRWASKEVLLQAVDENYAHE